VVTISDLLLMAPSSGDHLFTCGAIFWPPHIVGRAMPRNRFDEILRFLHIANSQHLVPNEQKGKLRPMMNHLQDVFQKAYIPEQHLSFDESMVAYYGRHGCKQFVRGKPIRFGLKNFCLCTPLGIWLPIDTYQGKTYRAKDYDNFRKGGRCLLNVTDSLQYDLNKLPTTFYCDSYFTGMPLIAELSHREQGLIGTIWDRLFVFLGKITFHSIIVD